ncbi:hypothetical protein GTPT_0006 [Tatumella ptyseos ATCC 33301]|uniref:Uncharacterized protein n=3 Tax=Tatumella ptyseos TaxID=82987 RepID=A0A085JQJ9_9GAMM|nr:hypothetical protein GTPT_0006 [Tatumella ptyseos ATCC 33301]SQK72312.1 Uncharacterised protein [Tatumella ptyseos]
MSSAVPAGSVISARHGGNLRFAGGRRTFIKYFKMKINVNFSVVIMPRGSERLARNGPEVLVQIYSDAREAYAEKAQAGAGYSP